MNRLKILRYKEKRKLEDELRERFGIEKIPGIIAQRGRERLFLFQGNFSIKQIKELEKQVFIERLGNYFAKVGEGGIRLSIEGTQLLKDQIKKNVFELNEEQTQEWMMGRELLIKTGKRGFLVIKHKDNFLGCGKASEQKIGNFIPKQRRLKQKESFPGH